jgi:hypothetical protein
MCFMTFEQKGLAQKITLCLFVASFFALNARPPNSPIIQLMQQFERLVGGAIVRSVFAALRQLKLLAPMPETGP